MSELNPEPNDLPKPAQISSTPLRSILNPNNASLNLSQQDDEQTSSLLVSYASTGKSATVHLKKIPKNTNLAVSEKAAAQVGQIQYVSSSKNTTTNSVTPGRPQIVYIKGRSNSVNNAFVVRPTLQTIPNFSKSIIKPLNKINVTKLVSNSHNGANPQVKICKPSAGSEVANSPKDESPVCIKNTVKIASKNSTIVSTTTNSTSSSNTKLLLSSHLVTVPKLQVANIGYVNVTPQMHSKGPILNFKISDGKINEDSIHYRDPDEVSSGIDAEKLERYQTPKQTSRQTRTEKDLSSNFIENGNTPNTNITTVKTMTSILKRNSILNTNNKPSESKHSEIKLELVDQGSSDTNISTDKVVNNELREKSCFKTVSVLKPQPRLKKQHLQVKEDLQEVCIEVLNPQYGNECKKKICKPAVRSRESISRVVHSDPMKNLLWKNGIGTLDNTNMHFKRNEFGLYDLLSEMEYDALITGRKDSKYYTPLAKRKEIQDNVRKSTTPDDVYECLSCASSGPAIEFISPDFCSTVCADVFKDRKRDLSPKQDPDGLPKVSRSPPGSKSNGEESNESDAEDDVKNSLYPWMHSKRGFSWSKYMSFKKAKPAPLKLFKDPFPYHQNGFKVGMKLEAIDPNHESYICVVSVVDVKGYRICLHFDSYPRKYNFWVNADSIDIFPCGWCEKNNHLLQPPRHISPDSFNWPNYLKQCKSVAAPKILFPHVTSESACPHGFRVGMKLEALDRKNSHKMCVATVADILFPQRFLVHFDGWDEMYDYWVDATSPYIHPVGWCEEHDATLIPPGGYSEQTVFNWDQYLKQTNSVAVPARAFKRRPMTGFSIGMKIEAVDVRVPFLVRVATIADVKNHSLKVSFDGWPPRYSFWVDDDSTIIHPVGWCSKTGHTLEPPLMPEDMRSSVTQGCGMPGCTGLGNAIDPQKRSHTSLKSCPYAADNINTRLDMGLDRLQFSDIDEKPYLSDAEEKPLVSQLSDVDEKLKFPKMSFKRSSSDLSLDKPTKKFGTGCFANGVKIKMEVDIKSEPNDGTYKAESGAESRLKNCVFNNVKFYKRKIKTESEQKISKQMEADIRASVFTPGPLPGPEPWPSRELWLKYTQPISYLIKKSNKKPDPRSWSIADVANFVSNIPNCAEYAYRLANQKIDGESFVMLTQKDLMTHCGLKLGPAIKIYNSILALREQIK